MTTVIHWRDGTLRRDGQIRASGFDESQHQRDERGRFAPKDSEGGDALPPGVRDHVAELAEKMRTEPVRLGKTERVFDQAAQAWVTSAVVPVERYAVRNGMTVEEYWVAADAKVAAEIEGRDLLIRQRADVIHEILASGDFENQFESKTSSGWISDTHSRRRATEGALFGVPVDIGADERPIYGYLGYLGDLDAAPDGEFGVRPYGQFIFKLKDDVRERSTWTDYDSLTREENPGGRSVGFVGAPTAAGVDLADSDPLTWGRPDPSKNPPSDYGPSGLYLEAQVHGGVTLDDVEAVYVDDRPSREIPTTGQAVDALDAAGIRWFHLNDDGTGWVPGNLEDPVWQWER